MLVAIGTGGMPDVVKLEGLKATLREKLSYLRQLDRDIEGLIEGEEDLTVEVQQLEDLAQEIHTAIAGIERALLSAPPATGPPTSSSTSLEGGVTGTITSGGRMKLPRLTLKPFNGDIT